MEGSIWRRGLLLPFALAVTAAISMFPHANLRTGEMRELPVHMDEYVHWGFASEMLSQGRVATGDPFIGSGSTSFNLGNHLHERGFQAALAGFHDATGIPWETMFAWGPMLIAVLSALMAFMIAERWGAGVEAALFVGAVPTTLRFLGPGFLVPVSFAIPLLFMGVYLVLEAQTTGQYVLLLIVAGALWTIHAMAAGVLLATGVLAAVALASRPARAAGLLAATLGPAIVAAPYYLSRFTGESGDPSLALDLGLFHLMGPIFFVLAAIGVALLVAGRKTFAAGIVLAGILILGFVVIIRRAATGDDVWGLYDRTMTLLPWFIALAAAAALAGAREGALTALRHWSGARWRAGLTGAVVLVTIGGGIVLTAAAGVRQMEQPYYEVVTSAQFDEYVSVADQMPADALALVDGHTLSFTVATGVPTAYVWMPGGAPASGDYAAFFLEGANDTVFLLDHQINVVVTAIDVSNPYLRRVSDSVYVLDPRIQEAVRGRGP